MKQIEVIICGQSYLLGCPEGGQAGLLEAVARVDREMTSIRESGKVKARERIAVLAALNLAYGLTEKPVADVDRSRPSGDAPADAGELDFLIRRLDAALGEPAADSARHE